MLSIFSSSTLTAATQKSSTIEDNDAPVLLHVRMQSRGNGVDKVIVSFLCTSQNRQHIHRTRTHTLMRACTTATTRCCTTRTAALKTCRARYS